MRLAFPPEHEALFAGWRARGRRAGAERSLQIESNATGGSACLFAAPVLPGMEEAWRRFLQEVAESRTEYGRLRDRLGLLWESVWLVPSARGYATVAYLEFDGDLDGFARRLAAADEAFDLWFKEGVSGCHGRIEPAEFSPGSALYPIFSWDESPGPS